MKITHKELNIQTGETTINELDETAQQIADRQAFEAEVAAKAQAQAEAAAAKAALLAKLGITEEEAKLLLS